MDLISCGVDPFLKALGSFPGPNNVVETVKSKILESLFQEVLRTHSARFPIGTGDVGDLLKPFFEILSDDGNPRVQEFIYLDIVVKLAYNSIRFPFFGPL